jgi:DNA repair photolyase
MELDKGNYGSPRWTYEILDCAMPMSFDTYSNCAHQCLYCFSFFQRAIKQGSEDYLHHKVRSVDVDKIKRMFLQPDEHAGQFKNYIKRRMTLQWGGLSDGFDWYEKKFLKSLELLRFFREIDYPISISTKGVWWVYDQRYMDILKDAKNIHVKYSIITDNEKHVLALEPGVPTAAARFDAMEQLNKLGIGATTLRFRPFTLGTSDLCIDSMFESGARVGCYSVTTEFLAWESRASNTSKERLEAMSKVLGYDVWQFYRDNSARASGLLRLNYDLKRPYIQKMKEKAAEVGMKFFVSDAHHKEDSYHAGCCGLPEDGPLSNVNHGQYAHAILIAKDKGIVKWSDISEEAREVLGDIPVYAAEGFPSDTDLRLKKRYMNMYDYMHDIWNNPKSWQSPARYFGGALVPAQTDENGDIQYIYNQPFVDNGLTLNTVNAIAKELRMTGKDNADRYDEMTADGTDHGHVAYPVYIFSRKRAQVQGVNTMVLLDNARLNYTLVVSEEDHKAYKDMYPHVDIMVVPEGNSIRKARQYIYENCKEEGYPYAWFLDDDIVDVKKEGKPVSMRNVFSELERFVEDYSNVCMLGTLKTYNTSPSLVENSYPFSVNEEVRGLFLINLLTGIDFSDTPEVYEDLSFAMKHLSTRKWVTVRHNEFTTVFNQGRAGGAANLYSKNNLQKEAAETLVALYPMHTIFSERPAPLGGDLIINWPTFTSSIRSRHVEALAERK